MRRIRATQLASLLAVVIAAFVALLLEPLPPLLEQVDSVGWTRLVEWFVLSAALLALLSWMELSNMEFEIGSGGVKAHRIEPGDVTDMRKVLRETQEDNRRLIEVARDLRAEIELLSSGPVGEGSDV